MNSNTENCLICLETLNNNILTFCCGTFHKTCIIKTIKLNNKCPICRFNYKDYGDIIDENTNNLDQVIYNYGEETENKINRFLDEWRNITSDLIARVYMIEQRMINQRNITSDLIARIYMIEERMKNQRNLL
tara:strand:- start:1216 stop:1611 length:396 start_codon:yes stop_codon:yes gene_type:complete